MSRCGDCPLYDSNVKIDTKCKGDLDYEVCISALQDALYDALAIEIADCKTEPQTIRCPKCGRTDYIKDMEKDMGIKDSYYKYKCINCNTYIKDELQTNCNPTCVFYDERCLNVECYDCCDGYSRYKPKDEPQKSCSTCGYSTLTPSCDTCEGYSNWWSFEDVPTGYNLSPVEDEP